MDWTRTLWLGQYGGLLGRIIERCVDGENHNGATITVEI